MSDTLNGTPLTLTTVEAEAPALKALTDNIETQLPGFRTAASAFFDRMLYARQDGISYGGLRDLYRVLGYPTFITNRQYRDRYERGGLSARVCEALPKATWRGEMEVVEDVDSKMDSVFEKAWQDIAQRLKITAVLRRVDILSQLSPYAVLFLGAAGETPFIDELPNANGDPSQLMYITPYSGSGGPSSVRLRGITPNRGGPDLDVAYATILEMETDTRDPRYGQPKFYQIMNTVAAADQFTQKIHWSRVIHIAEGVLDTEVYGEPGLRRVWNLLNDLDKVTGGGAEAFWLRANQGTTLTLDKDATFLPAEKAALEEKMLEWQNQLTRFMVLRKAQLETKGSDVANFSGPADTIITQIAGAKGIPKRILTGSEMGELASSQDRDNWKDQVDGRQQQYAGPYIVRVLVDRLVKYGYLPKPSKGELAYEVKWPHIQTLTEQEKADGAAKWASVNQTAGVTVFSADEIRHKWYNLEPGELDDEEMWRAALALQMATTNKTQGVVVFTSAEIRKTAYGWEPLPPEEEVPIGAPEKISVSAPPPLEEGQPSDVAAVQLKPVAGKPAPGKPVAVPKAAASNEEAENLELLRVLRAAIEAGNTDVIHQIVGVK